MGKLKTKNIKILKIATIISAILFLAMITIFSIIYFSYNNKIFPNIHISGINLANTSQNEAFNLLTSNLKVTDKIVFVAGDKNFEIDTSEIELSYDFEKSVQRAYYFTNSGNFIWDSINKLNLLLNSKNFGLEINYNETSLDQTLKIISQKIGTPPVYPSVKLSGNSILIDKGKNGVEIDIQKTKENLLQNITQQNNSPTPIYYKFVDVELSQENEINIRNRAQILSSKNIDLSYEHHSFTISKNDLLSFLNYGYTYDKNQVLLYIDNIAKSVNRNSQNSIFIFSNGKVEEFKPSMDGVLVDNNKLADELINTLKLLEAGDQKTMSINIPVTLTPAKIKTEDVNNLGINSLLGRGVSYYRGSIANRVFNINHASSKFKGILLAPGEAFSFNNVLGDVTALTGYKSAYVIKDGRTVLGDGGGVCQVSTTLFRAVLDAGLPIDERRAHSYRVGYYEQGFSVGLDATVYYPTTDFKFTNNTPAHLLIQSEIDIPHSTLVFEIYGTDDGRISSTSKPIITSSIAPPEDLYVDDPALPTGTIKQIEHKAWGARVVFDYLVKRGDEILTEKTFVSAYRPWQAVFLRGTGPAI